MKKGLIVALSLVSTLVWVPPSHGAIEKRCGWLDNPTPANWWLTDRDGDWTISVQGGYAALGMENIPEFDSTQYVETNGFYGYACACMDVTTDREDMNIITIHSVEQLPLATCHRDRALPQR